MNALENICSIIIGVIYIMVIILGTILVIPVLPIIIVELADKNLKEALYEIYIEVPYDYLTLKVL